MSFQCNDVAKRAVMVLGCTKREISGGNREAILLLYIELVRPLPGHCVLFWSPYIKEDMEILKGVQRRAPKIIQGLGNKPYDVRLKELNLFSLSKR